MQSSIGQSIALVSFAQASCRGEFEELDWRNNPWFEYTETYKFGIGESGGQIVAEDPNQWIQELSVNCFIGAALFVEPYAPGSDVYMQVGFAGGGRWAPVTKLQNGSEVIWHERPRFEKRGDSGVWHVYRGGFQVLPEQNRMKATIENAAMQLDKCLERITTFQRQHRPDEPFSDMFEAGRRQLRGRGLVPNPLSPITGEDEIYNRAKVLFPSKANPNAIALVAAVEAAWALGGMGWWNDWYCSDQQVLKQYQELTGEYYSALVTALAAACEPLD